MWKGNASYREVNKYRGFVIVQKKKNEKSLDKWLDKENDYFSELFLTKWDECTGKVIIYL